MKRLKKWAKRLLIFAVGLYIISGLFLYFNQDKFIFHPIHLEEDHEYDFVRPFEEVEITMRDGVELNAIHFPIKKPKGVILYWHGNGGNAEEYAKVTPQFNSRNYATFICDYREYGKSDGVLSQETWWSDGQDVYDYVKTLYPEEEIVLYGWSMGTSVATYLAANNEPNQLILEAPFWSIEELAIRMFKFVPIKGMIKFPIRQYEYMPDVKCRITAFHGTEDRVIPIEHGRRVTALNENCEFIVLEGGKHNGAKLFQEYQDKLDELLLGYVRPDQTEIVVTRRAKAQPTIEARADSLQKFYNLSWEPARADSIWLLYFRNFPRNIDEFQNIFGDGDTASFQPLEKNSTAHLEAFFNVVWNHPRIEPTDLFIDLSKGMKKSGGATEILRREVWKRMSEGNEALSRRTQNTQETFVDFYEPNEVLLDTMGIPKDRVDSLVLDAIETLHDTLDQ